MMAVAHRRAGGRPANPFQSGGAKLSYADPRYRASHGSGSGNGSPCRPMSVATLLLLCGFVYFLTSSPVSPSSLMTTAAATAAATNSGSLLQQQPPAATTTDIQPPAAPVAQQSEPQRLAATTDQQPETVDRDYMTDHTFAQQQQQQQQVHGGDFDNREHGGDTELQGAGSVTSWHRSPPLLPNDEEEDELGVGPHQQELDGDTEESPSQDQPGSSDQDGISGDLPEDGRLPPPAAGDDDELKVNGGNGSDGKEEVDEEEEDEDEEEEDNEKDNGSDEVQGEDVQESKADIPKTPDEQAEADSLDTNKALTADNENQGSIGGDGDETTDQREDTHDVSPGDNSAAVVESDVEDSEPEKPTGGAAAKDGSTTDSGNDNDESGVNKQSGDGAGGNGSGDGGNGNDESDVEKQSGDGAGGNGSGDGNYDNDESDVDKQSGDGAGGNGSGDGGNDNDDDESGVDKQPGEAAAVHELDSGDNANDEEEIGVDKQSGDAAALAGSKTIDQADPGNEIDIDAEKLTKDAVAGTKTSDVAAAEDESKVLNETAANEDTSKEDRVATSDAGTKTASHASDKLEVDSKQEVAGLSDADIVADFKSNPAVTDSGAQQKEIVLPKGEKIEQGNAGADMHSTGKDSNAKKLGDLDESSKAAQADRKPQLATDNADEALNDGTIKGDARAQQANKSGATKPAEAAEAGTATDAEDDKSLEDREKVVSSMGSTENYAKTDKDVDQVDAAQTVDAKSKKPVDEHVKANKSEATEKAEERGLDKDLQDKGKVQGAAKSVDKTSKGSPKDIDEAVDISKEELTKIREKGKAETAGEKSDMSKMNSKAEAVPIISLDGATQVKPDMTDAGSKVSAGAKADNGKDTPVATDAEIEQKAAEKTGKKTNAKQSSKADDANPKMEDISKVTDVDKTLDDATAKVKALKSLKDQSVPGNDNAATESDMDAELKAGLSKDGDKDKDDVPAEAAKKSLRGSNVNAVKTKTKSRGRKKDKQR